MNLTLEVDRESDGRFIAEGPDLPGVLAYGSTQRGSPIRRRCSMRRDDQLLDADFPDFALFAVVFLTFVLVEAFFFPSLVVLRAVFRAFVWGVDFAAAFLREAFWVVVLFLLVFLLDFLLVFLRAVLRAFLRAGLRVDLRAFFCAPAFG